MKDNTMSPTEELKRPITLEFNGGTRLAPQLKYSGVDHDVAIECNINDEKSCTIHVTETKATQLLTDFPHMWIIKKGEELISDNIHLIIETQQAEKASKGKPSKKDKKLAKQVKAKGEKPNWNMKYEVLKAWADENDIEFEPAEGERPLVAKRVLWELIKEKLDKKS